MVEVVVEVGLDVVVEAVVFDVVEDDLYCVGPVGVVGVVGEAEDVGVCDVAMQADAMEQTELVRVLVLYFVLWIAEVIVEMTGVDVGIVWTVAVAEVRVLIEVLSWGTFSEQWDRDVVEVLMATGEVVQITVEDVIVLGITMVL